MSERPARQVVMATRNSHKLAEAQRILAQVLKVELLGLAQFPSYVEPPEQELTFTANALVKARHAASELRRISIADDSGLAVDALRGMPGVLSARWAGRHGDDKANLQLLLNQLQEFPDSLRTASFVCAAALVTTDGREYVVEERVTGHLIREPRGSHGFGYDPIFVPTGASVTTAEMDPKDKDEISHRGKALRALAVTVQTDRATGEVA